MASGMSGGAGGLAVVSGAGILVGGRQEFACDLFHFVHVFIIRDLHGIEALLLAGRNGRGR